jgi:UDP-2-acetamido-2,6-beta-L-arabino-hexul-4-ose reductase
VKIAVSGINGFIGQNLRFRLTELGHEVLGFDIDTQAQERRSLLNASDVLIHLAGVNRPQTTDEFFSGNRDFTQQICDELLEVGPKPVLFTSSTQAELDNPYGQSKRFAEAAIDKYAAQTGVTVHSVRLPNVFGKWSRPHYNSAVATFCYCIARGLPIQINDPDAPLNLVYIDSVVHFLIQATAAVCATPPQPVGEVEPIYRTTVGQVATMLHEFNAAEKLLTVGDVGVGLRRALYATFISFLPTERFSSQVPIHSDPRGDFVEMLRTPSAGQFSYFTAHPGVTRGCHYHHTKTEKFLVIQGQARFRFRSLIRNESFETVVQGGRGTIVDTIPGWVHDVTNIGQETLIVMLWANEIFEKSRPDTIAAEL